MEEISDRTQAHDILHLPCDDLCHGVFKWLLVLPWDSQWLIHWTMCDAELTLVSSYIGQYLHQQRKQRL